MKRTLADTNQSWKLTQRCSIRYTVRHMAHTPERIAAAAGKSFEFGLGCFLALFIRECDVEMACFFVFLFCTHEMRAPTNEPTNHSQVNTQHNTRARARMCALSLCLSVCLAGCLPVALPL